jgi:predicted nucleic acid-binding protein
MSRLRNTWIRSFTISGVKLAGAIGVSVTLDTNIYVSAVEFGGKPTKLIQMAMNGEIEVAISQPIVEETIRIVRDKFRGIRQVSPRGRAVTALGYNEC